ncbi:MAG: hypothetical protein WKF33_12315, partial [Thermoleophilaceae bacterium]
EGSRLTWALRITRPMRFNLRFDVTVDADQMTGTSKAGRLPTGTCFYLNARPNHAVNLGAP